MEPDKLNNPIDVGSLRVDGIMVNSLDPTDLIREFGLLTIAGDRHSILLQNRDAVSSITATG
jgi:hypothetical protein